MFYIQFIIEYKKTNKMNLFNEQLVVNFKTKNQLEPFEYPQFLQGQIRSNLKPNKREPISQKLSSKTKFLQIKKQMCFGSLCRMLFPECNGEGISSIDINILDTIFYKNDGSLFYVYYDNKRGLINMKNKNIYETFLKRSEQQQTKYSYLNHSNTSLKSQNSKIKSTSYKYVAGSARDYFAILRYKDDTIMRLKQTDFKAIFTNPLYANQKLKNINNTKYIQTVPTSQQQLQNNSVVTIPFASEDYQKDQLFQLALKITCDQGCFVGQVRKSKIIKDKIKMISKQVYLYYLVFQIYSYILIHYNKSIKKAIFRFLKLSSGQFSLMNISQIVMQSDYNVQGRYERRLLFQQDEEKGLIENELFDQIDQNYKESSLQTEIINYFSQQNAKLKKSVMEFIQKKFSAVKNMNDEQISNQIFRVLNPNIQMNFQTLLADDKQFLKFLNHKFAEKYFKDKFKFKEQSGKRQQKVRPKTVVNRNNGQKRYLLKPYKLTGEIMPKKKNQKIHRQLAYSIQRSRI